MDADFVYDNKKRNFETAFMKALYDYGHRLGSVVTRVAQSRRRDADGRTVCGVFSR